jgi:hypothetical protein
LASIARGAATNSPAAGPGRGRRSWPGWTG